MVLKYKATYVVQGFKVPEQYFNVVCVLAYIANNYRLQNEMKNKASLEGALRDAPSTLFSSPKLPSIVPDGEAQVVTQPLQIPAQHVHRD